MTCLLRYATLRYAVPCCAALLLLLLLLLCDAMLCYCYAMLCATLCYARAARHAKPQVRA